MTGLEVWVLIAAGTMVLMGLATFVVVVVLVTIDAIQARFQRRRRRMAFESEQLKGPYRPRGKR